MLQNTASDARGRLLAAAFEIATRDGVDAVSTRAVCAAAGVQAPSLYYHFGDRSGLVRAVVDAAFEEYFHRKDTSTSTDSADPRARVAAGWDAHIAFALAYPLLYPAMYPTSGPLPSQVEQSGALLRAGFDEIERAGALRPGITAALATDALRAALRGVAHAVAANPDSSDNDATSAVVRDALIQALVAGGAPD
ncbi:TetR/AcrR family transcriptional regulator [Amycolatopsis sp. GM8]|uniref:TetR/AcrR family transcriptional regulator n=1 Tax=Amycolatopsis sp. GM8 TaxID=2896530 RepID=UPI001F40E5DC|nr:TetR/AcrR family transcriptional regulator [Amycolatopsis sp. GM8]